MSFFLYGELVAKKLKAVLPKTIVHELTTCSYDELMFYHFTLGGYFRNVMLDEKGELYRWLFYDLHVYQKDDMSELLLKLLYFYLKDPAQQDFPENRKDGFHYI